MGPERLQPVSLISVLISVLLVFQTVTGQQCNCNNPQNQKSQGNDKLNGMLLNKFNQLRDNSNVNSNGPQLQFNKQSMPSLASFGSSLTSNTQQSIQDEMKIPISSFRTTNGNSDSAQKGINLGLIQNPSSAANSGLSELKINKFQFIPNTPGNQKSITPHFEAQMLPMPLAISPRPSDTPPCQNQVCQVSEIPCAHNVPQTPTNCASNMNFPQNLQQNVENNYCTPQSMQPQISNSPEYSNSPCSEVQSGQVQNQPQVVYLVLPPQAAPVPQYTPPVPQYTPPAPQYNPPVYYAPASSSSKSLSMKSLLPLLLEMLQEKKNCGCQSCPHCGSPLNPQDPSAYGNYANTNMYGEPQNNIKEFVSEQTKEIVETPAEIIEDKKEIPEKSAALKMPEDGSKEQTDEKSTEYLEPEFEDESLEDSSIEK